MWLLIFIENKSKEWRFNEADFWEGVRSSLSNSSYDLRIRCLVSINVHC